MNAFPDSRGLTMTSTKIILISALCVALAGCGGVSVKSPTGNSTYTAGTPVPVNIQFSTQPTGTQISLDGNPLTSLTCTTSSPYQCTGQVYPPPGSDSLAVSANMACSYCTKGETVSFTVTPAPAQITTSPANGAQNLVCCQIPVEITFGSPATSPSIQLDSANVTAQFTCTSAACNCTTPACMTGLNITPGSHTLAVKATQNQTPESVSSTFSVVPAMVVNLNYQWVPGPNVGFRCATGSVTISSSGSASQTKSFNETADYNQSMNTGTCTASVNFPSVAPGSWAIAASQNAIANNGTVDVQPLTASCTKTVTAGQQATVTVNFPACQ